MFHHLQFEQWVPYPLEHVFAFFSNPENLPRLMPASSAMRLDDLTRVPPPTSAPGDNKAADTGSILVTSFRMLPFLPIRGRWIARIAEFEQNHHFADVQDKGPFKRWHHRHEFAAENRDGVDGTLVRDVIDYEIGFGWLGDTANALFVRRQMENTFRNRQETLSSLLANE
jgi:ligand-binding SRPBCC domain-containing protein